MTAVFRLTFREAIRKRFVLAVGSLSVLFAALFLYGVHLQQQTLAQRSAAIHLRGPVQGGGPQLVYGFLLVMGLYMATFLASLVAILGSVGTLSGELESGTLLTILTKPLHRRSILLAKWGGHLAMSALFMALLDIVLIGGTRLLTGFLPPHPWLGGLLQELDIAFLVTLTLLGSTSLSTVANGVVVVLLYGLAWVGGVLATVGQLTRTELLVHLATITKFLLPSDALWRGTSDFLQSAATLKLSRGLGGNPLVGTHAPAQGFLIWAGCYLLLLLALAAWRLERRDL